MSNFIEQYSQVLSPQDCQLLIKLFNESKIKTVAEVQGKLPSQEQNIQEIILNQSAEYTQTINQVKQILLPCIEGYFEKYYHALLAATTMTIIHPETKEPVKLNGDNFLEVGLPQIKMIINHLFRFDIIKIQKTIACSGVTTLFHSECYPQKGSDEVLHRMLNLHVSLNDVEQGGETEFFEWDKKTPQKAGELIIFPAYFSHSYKQNAPVSNDRYQLQTWFKYHRAEKLYQ